MRRIAAPTLAAVVVLLAPAPAPADTFDDVFAHYRKAGRVDPCRFSAPQLERARRQVPNDIEQYAPDFPDELDRALSARARGACDEKAAVVPPGAPGGTAAPASPAPATPSAPEAPAAASPPAATATPQPTPQAVPAANVSDDAIAAAAARREGDAGAPAALVVLAALLGTLLLWLLAWGAVRWGAWEPAWLLRARHATAEAGWRASAAWAEFTDWVKIGR